MAQALRKYTDVVSARFTARSVLFNNKNFYGFWVAHVQEDEWINLDV